MIGCLVVFALMFILVGLPALAVGLTHANQKYDARKEQNR